MNSAGIGTPLIVMMVLAAASSPGASAACSRSVTADGKPRYEIKGAEVQDRLTGLVWQRCSVGLIWSRSGCTGDRADVSYPDAEAAASAAGRPWRLPTVQELSSLVDDDCGKPTIDTRAFPDVSASTDEGAEEYWTSTRGGLDEMMYFVEFADGTRDIRSPGFKRHARLVRSGR